MRNFLFGLLISVLIIISALGGALADRFFVIKPLDQLMQRRGLPTSSGQSSSQFIYEENAVIDVASKASPSVVTVSVVSTTRPQTVFDPFGLFGDQSNTQGEGKSVTRDIGTGFIVDKAGLIVTNKHVVSEVGAKYKVIEKDDTEYEVKDVYRDPIIDLAILRIEPKDGKELAVSTLGDSSKIKVGQFVVAIGTALGEFRHTVTTGVISGLGRGIQAGDQFAGQVEEIENVIQTDAAINPGNSGGPLLTSSGEVIGVNVAVAGNAQNIGFAVPINVIKEAIDNFQQTGQFKRAMLGVRYRMISKDAALYNEVPEGAYIVEVVEGATADQAGIVTGDIMISFDGVKVKDIKGGLAAALSKKKVGDKVTIEYWRNGENKKVEVVLKEVVE